MSPALSPHAPSTPSRWVSRTRRDRKSTRLNSSHSQISYAVFCLKKKKKSFVASHAATQGQMKYVHFKRPQQLFSRYEPSRLTWHGRPGKSQPTTTSRASVSYTAS